MAQQRVQPNQQVQNERVLPMTSRKGRPHGAGGTLLDKDWIRRSFLVDAKDYDAALLEMRTMSTAKFKWVTSGFGGNLVCNPLPQSALFTDPPPVKTEIGQKSFSVDSLGHFHSEAFDDNMHVIHMRFGVPAFNSLWRFLNGMYDYNAGKYARTGRGAGVIYNVARIGFGFAGALIGWPIMGLALIDRVGRFFLNKPSSRFYFLKPTMPVYWDIVQTIVNHLAINRGIIFYDSPFTSSSNYSTDDFHVSPQEKAMLHRQFPEIIDEDGSVDVFALMNRAQRQWRRHLDVLIKRGLSEPDSIATRLRQSYSDLVGGDFGSVKSVRFYDYFKKWMDNPASAAADSDNPWSDMDLAGDQNSMGPTGITSFLEAEASDGGQWVSFRVNHGGPVSESFSNDFKSSDLGDKINSTGASVRNARFDLGNGNIGDNFVADMVEGVMEGIKSIGHAALDTVGLNGLAVLGGAAFADFPQYWDRSSANLPSMSYSMDLISPANDPIAQLMNIYIPLAMLLAAALPRSAGKQSHVEPFLCELYDQGRAQTRLGMFKSLSITRGEGNIGWDNRGHYLQVKVNFEIADMGGICTLPVSESIDWGDTLTAAASGAAVGGAMAGPLGAVGGAFAGGAAKVLGKSLFDDDSYFHDYMAILSGLGLASQIHRMDKLKRRLALNVANGERLFSKARLAAYTIDGTMGGQIASMFFFGNARMR